MWYWCKDRHVDQWNRGEGQGIKLHIQSNDFWQGCRDRGERTISSTNDAGKTGYAHAKE